MKHRYDAIVIGSGAAGSFAAMGLTEQGLDVLVLEAGRTITTDDFPIPAMPPKAPILDVWPRMKAAMTGQWMQSRTAFYHEKLRHFFVNDRDHPYSTDADAPFLWVRGRQVGGRMHTFGRVLMRWSDGDFKAASRDGYEQDWPIAYRDLEPFYARAEEILGVRGCPEQIASIPDGNFQGPAWLTTAERAFKQSIEGRWPERRATTWRYMPPNARRVPVPLLTAVETGRCTVRSDAIVRRILTDPATGWATGVEFVDRHNSTIHSVDAGAVMICASPIESVRLLLNSAAGRHPRGIGNGSGLLGRYFMDQVPSIILGTVPGLTGIEEDNSVPADPFYGKGGGIYVPRWENVLSQTNPAFLRGYGYQGNVGRMLLKEGQPAQFGFFAFGEMLPRPDNRITLNPSRKDRWGIPIPHIRCTMGDNDLKILKAQCSSMVEMAQGAGLDINAIGTAQGVQESGCGLFPDFDWLSRKIVRRNFKKSMMMGAAIHESGGARMGSDPATSVLNDRNQIWDAPNIFVTDASSFATGGTTGTTLTVMAVTLRATGFVSAAID